MLSEAGRWKLDSWQLRVGGFSCSFSFKFKGALSGGDDVGLCATRVVC
jgi:hypothetical protein